MEKRVIKIPATNTQEQTAKRSRAIRSRKTSAGGILLEIIGFIILFGGWVGGMVGMFVGFFIGLICIIKGHNLSRGWKCEDCGNSLADKKVKLCPTCRAVLA